MRIRYINTGQENHVQSVRSLIEWFESMPMRGRVYGPQNRILKSERDGGHNVSALRLKFESLAQNQSPQKERPQRIRRSESNCGQEVGSRIQFFESMPMSGRAFGPQNRILSSERDGGNNVRALIRRFEDQKAIPLKIRAQERNRLQAVSGLRQTLSRRPLIVEALIQIFDRIILWFVKKFWTTK
jgi:hypothetical protein